LLELEPGVSTSEVEAESQRTQLSLPLKPARARKHPGRQQLPAGLPREEQIIACTPDQCVCGSAAKKLSSSATKLLSNSMSSREVLWRVTKREKRACKACEEQGVQCAPLPARIIDKGLASDRVIIDTVVSKYADHVPLYAAPGIDHYAGSPDYADQRLERVYNQRIPTGKTRHSRSMVERRYALVSKGARSLHFSDRHTCLEYFESFSINQ
jgi:transposase